MIKKGNAMNLLHKTITFQPPMNKTTLSFRIDIPQDLHSLLIHIHYSPKYLMDQKEIQHLTMEGIQHWGYYLSEGNLSSIPKCDQIANLITLSLNNNDAFLGFAHRHDPDMDLIISEDKASPGFHRFCIHAGNIDVFLHANYIASREVTYDLDVEGIL